MYSFFHQGIEFRAVCLPNTIFNVGETVVSSEFSKKYESYLALQKSIAENGEFKL